MSYGPIDPLVIEAIRPPKAIPRGVKPPPIELRDWEKDLTYAQAELRYRIGVMSHERWRVYIEVWEKARGNRFPTKHSGTVSINKVPRKYKHGDTKRSLHSCGKRKRKLKAKAARTLTDATADADATAINRLVETMPNND